MRSLLSVRLSSPFEEEVRERFDGGCCSPMPLVEDDDPTSNPLTKTRGDEGFGDEPGLAVPKLDRSRSCTSEAILWFAACEPQPCCLVPGTWSGSDLPLTLAAADDSLTSPTSPSPLSSPPAEDWEEEASCSLLRFSSSAPSLPDEGLAFTTGRPIRTGSYHCAVGAIMTPGGAAHAHASNDQRTQENTTRHKAHASTQPRHIALRTALAYARDEAGGLGRAREGAGPGRGRIVVCSRQNCRSACPRCEATVDHPLRCRCGTASIVARSRLT